LREEGEKNMIDAILEEHLKVAIDAARRAGELVLASGREGHLQLMEKHDNDFVTETDRASERLIISIIKESFPKESIFGEESGEEDSSMGQRRWIIDPVDGTSNFFRGVPNYTISIGWEKEKFQPLVGVVYNPRQDELFYARKGGGAFLNGKKLEVSRITDPKRSLLVCVPPSRHHEAASGYFKTEETLFMNCSDVRSFGSCALELSYLAAGRLDGYYELFLGYYDCAGGAVILREAGGVIECLGGFSDTRCDIVASNGYLQSWLKEIVNG